MSHGEVQWLHPSQQLMCQEVLCSLQIIYMATAIAGEVRKRMGISPRPDPKPFAKYYSRRLGSIATGAAMQVVSRYMCMFL